MEVLSIFFLSWGESFWLLFFWKGMVWRFVFAHFLFLLRSYIFLWWNWPFTHRFWSPATIRTLVSFGLTPLFLPLKVSHRRRVTHNSILIYNTLFSENRLCLLYLLNFYGNLSLIFPIPSKSRLLTVLFSTDDLTDFLFFIAEN